VVAPDRISPGIEAHEQWAGGIDTIQEEALPAFTIPGITGRVALQGIDNIYSRVANGHSATSTVNMPLAEVTTEPDYTDAIPDELMPATIRDFEHELAARYRELTGRRPQNIDEGQGSDLDGLHLYGDTIGCYPRLSKDQSTELAKMIEAGVLARGLLDKDNLYGHSSDAEQLALVVAIGDRAYQVLYLSNLKLVMSLAKHHARDDVFPLLDAIQEGNTLLHRAIYRYDYKRNEAAFSSFAYEVVAYGLKSAYTEARKHQKATLIGDSALANVAEGAYDLHGTTASPSSERTLRLADEALNALTPAQQIVFLLRYGLKGTKGAHSVDDIARRLGYTEASVKGMLAQGHRRLRQHFEKCDYPVSGSDVQETPEIPQSTKDAAISEGPLWPGAFSGLTARQRELITETLPVLTPRRRGAVALFYGLEDNKGPHKLRDIASQMGYASPASVATALYQSRLRMREYLENRDRPRPAVTYEALQGARIGEFDTLVTTIFDYARDDSLSDEDYLRTMPLRTTIERAILLLGADRAAVISRYYGAGFDEPMSRQEIAKATGIRDVKSILWRARRELRVLIPAMAQGSLDLVAWHKRNSSRRNVLVYLARVGVDIPPEYSLSNLRVLARRHIAELPVREDQREILTKLYGLSADGTSHSAVNLEAAYGVSDSAISELEDRYIRNG